MARILLACVESVVIRTVSLGVFFYPFSDASLAFAPGEFARIIPRYHLILEIAVSRSEGRFIFISLLDP